MSEVEVLDPTRAARDSVEDRILAATLRCVARWGIGKTTLDDIAREARCSRATVYRCFPGGKDVLLEATWRRELTDFFAALTGAVDRLETLEDVLVHTLSTACREIAEHDALQYLLSHEPGAILPFVAFDGLDPLLQWSADFAGPRLARFVPADVAEILGPWIARLVVSYGFEPTDGSPDLTDEVVARRFVRTYVLPGVAALGVDPAIDLATVPERHLDLSTDPTTASTAVPAPQEHTHVHH